MIKKYKNKSKAQTMVEFALVLPILMMLIFGLLEVGRMVFVYVTIASASREAVRYGSATGDVAIFNSSDKRYADCDGIREAAQNVNFLNVFTNNDIHIEYYQRDGTFIATCPIGGSGPASISNGDRIYVRVEGNFEPIVDFVPLMDRKVGTNPIISENYHTLINSAEVPIVWSQPGESSGGNPCSNCFDPNEEVCLNHPEWTYEAAIEFLLNGWAKDAIGNCFEIPESGDFCPNIKKDQTSIPPGYYIDEVGDCISPETIDVCPNLEGIQESIPLDKMLDVSSGNCVIDYCANIVGIQYALPNIYYYEYPLVPLPDGGYDPESRQCVVKPTCPSGQVYDYDEKTCVGTIDYCLNLPGDQGAIPEGSVRDEEGNCDRIPICRYSHSGEVPTTFVVGEKNTTATWQINNNTDHPLTITRSWITWNDTDADLFLDSISFGSIQKKNLRLSVSGYSPLANGESIIIPGGVTLQMGLTFNYQRPAPEGILIKTDIEIDFDQANCYFGPAREADALFPADPNLLPQPYCEDKIPTGLNILYSSCDIQK